MSTADVILQTCVLVMVTSGGPGHIFQSIFSFSAKRKVAVAELFKILTHSRYFTVRAGRMLEVQTSHSERAD